FQVTFTLQQDEPTRANGEGLQVAPFEVLNDTSKFDLELFVTDCAEGFLLELQYNTDLFDTQTATRMLAHLETLLVGVVADVAQEVDLLPLMKEAEKQQLLVTWNATMAEQVGDACIHRQFEAQVAQTPEWIAAVFEERTITYGELNTRANQLARVLQRYEVGADVRVGIYMNRSLDMLVAMLGVLKAGGAYVPLDPAYPPERLAYLISDAQMPVLVTQQALVSQLPEHTATVIALDAQESELDAESGENLPDEQMGSRLAYVIYTSGSTGQPKGVMVAHRNVTNFFLGMDQLFKSAGTGRDTLLAVTSMSFDISVLELLWTLTRGDQVVILSERGGIFNEETPGLSLLELLTKHQVTMLQGTPSLMQLIMNSSEGLTELQSLRLLLLGGEPLPMRMAHELCMRVPAALYNMYGPTETTIWSTVMKVEDGSAITIGAPIANTQVYILDEQMNPVPIGVKGELYIGGAGVTCGYLHRPELTSERFVRDPFSAEEAARLYKTGDLARWREQGQIEYLGRLDQQVKIRGHRIEQGEIEAVLTAHADVREAAVITTQDADTQLVAYVVPEFKRDEVERVEREVLHEQVDQWQVVFEDLYRSESVAEEVVFDTSIWKDSYTGELVAEEQMQEWVDRTVERIVRRNPKRVLEIGCGSGLLLTRVAPQCEHYTATDFSQSVLQSVGRRVQTLGLDTSNIRLLQKMADDFSGLEQETFDLIVINSVVQYFPNVKYLLQVLQQAVEHVKPGGSIFLGDIRHYGLLKEFVASVVLAQANADLSVMELSNLVTQVLQQEEEMVIDPDFFARLPEVIPGITQVEIELKRGHFHNEMSKYRYDVTLHIEQSELQHGEMPAWNWTVATSTLEQVRTHLAVEKPIALRLLNVPNRRLVADVLAARWLDEPHTQRTARDVQKSMAEQAETGVEPERFFALEEEFPYRVHIGWARSSRKDAYDVTLIRCEPGSGQALPIVSHQL
ncbi:MAG: non-ribosomal peptide synthetase, partial [Tumebacillaceae bacterium]